jgi:3alpha(or 20beta)-hydroxysteroid dehydrogenase
MGRLQNKVAIITGAAQGMGAWHARLFVAEGARVVLTDINSGAGEVIAKELGERAIFVRHDVSEKKAWEEVVHSGEARFGDINILVNNAGILGPVTPLLQLTVDDYLRVVSVNQLATMLGMQAVLPSMLRGGSGSIVNISSVAGIVASYDTPNLAYIASKYAVRGMTKQVALEFADKKIRVNCVHPGYIRTPMMFAATSADQGGSGSDFLSNIPMGRIGEPSEVSNLVLFLASDESSFITGYEHVIDGGATAY